MSRAHLAPYGLQRDESGEEAATLAPERVRVHWLRPRARRRDERGQLEKRRATARAHLEDVARGTSHELVQGIAHLGRMGDWAEGATEAHLVGVVVVRRCGGGGGVVVVVWWCGGGVVVVWWWCGGGVVVISLSMSIQMAM